jgi:hypothetical protein
MSDTVTVFDEGLRARQLEVRKDAPVTKPFMDGRATLPLSIDAEVYEQARLANLEVYGGRNCWDDPEFVRDMAERHPEIRNEVRGNTFCFAKRMGGGKMRSRYGKVKERIRFRDGYRIAEGDGVRTVKHLQSGVTRFFDRMTGVEL